MEEAVEVELAKKRCRDVIHRIQNLPVSTNISDSSRRTLLKLVHSELNFLSRCSSYSSSSSNPISVNIGHLEAVVHILQQPLITGVSRVCKPIRSAKKNNCPSENGVYVDIVGTVNKDPVWIIVSDRNPKYISWHRGHKTKGLKYKIQELLDFARSSQTLKPCSVILFFSNGISNFILERLRDEFAASEFDFDFSENLEEDWVCVLARSYSEACALNIKVTNINDLVSGSECNIEKSTIGSCDPNILENHSEKDMGDAFCSTILGMKSCPLDIKEVESGSIEHLLSRDDNLINFDTTALIALVTGISNGCTENLLATSEGELRRRFKGNYDFVIGQVISEIQKPILQELGDIIRGKRGIICRTVHSEFKELVLTCGGPNEKSRADQLLKHLRVVPDWPSERIMCLPTTRKLALKNKVIFGTGDHWRAPTLNANMGFVRAVSQTGMSLFTIQHRPRALIGD